MRVYYDKRQSVKGNQSFSPSSQKSALLAAEWKRLGLPVDIQTFKPATRSELYQVHDREYVDGVLDLNRDNGYGNRNPKVAQSLPWVVGSFLNAVKYSMKTRQDSWSLTSGAHHAHKSYGSGFCSFNFLMLGALAAKNLGAKKIILIDLDRHAPDGCRQIQKEIGLSELSIYAFGDQMLQTVEDTEGWLKKLPPILLSLCDGADLVFFNAGVDPATTDFLGGLMTAEQMSRRDRLVFETAKMFNVPVVVSLAGGYSRDSKGTPRPTVELHTETMRQHLLVHGVQS